VPDSTRGADAAAAALRADYERWSRLACGVLSFVGAVLGLVFAGAMVDMLVRYARTPSDVVLASGMAVIGAAAAVTGIVVLFRLWRTGRALSRAAVVWLRVPYLLGVRDRKATGWLAPRVVDDGARVFARIACCSISLLVAVFGLSIVFYPGWSGMIATPVACALAGVVAAACLVGQAGGVATIVRGIRERDPRWMRSLAVPTRES
jgi:hypothetical protein